MRLRLDAHVSPMVARGLRQQGVDALAIQDWQAGTHRDAPDEVVLTAALGDARVLATYDCRTIPALLKSWADVGRAHAGVILVDDRTILPSDIGGLIRALVRLATQSGEDTWLNRVIFLRAM